MTLEKFKIEVLPLNNKLYRLAIRLLNNVQESEDVVQEVFLRLWSKKEALYELKSIEAFALTITKNLCFDRMKSKGYHTGELDENYDRVGENTPHTKLEHSESYREIQKIISKLPEQQRIIIHLRDIEEYDLDEIAQITEMNMNTIRVNLSRARKKVREMLSNIYNYEFAKN